MKKQNSTIKGEKATDYVENVEKSSNIDVDHRNSGRNPANEILDLPENNDISLIVCVHTKN